MVRNLLAVQKTWLQFLGQEDHLEKRMVSYARFLPGEFHEQRSLVSYNAWCCKESDIFGQESHQFCSILQLLSLAIATVPQLLKLHSGAQSL